MGEPGIDSRCGGIPRQRPEIPFQAIAGQDQIFTNDTHVYPYYIIFRPNPSQGGPSIPEEHPFAEGDTVPDKAYVVFKALGWDDPRDQRLGTSPFDVQFQAAFEDTGLFGGTSRFPFATQLKATPPARQSESAFVSLYKWLTM